MKPRISKRWYPENWGFGIGLGIVKRFDVDDTAYLRFASITFWRWNIGFEIVFKPKGTKQP